MRPLLLALIFWAISLILYPEGWLSQVSQPLQDACLVRASNTEQLEPVISAVICGKRIRSAHPLKQNLIKLSLNHLLVVSGAHLRALQKAFTFVFRLRSQLFLTVGLALFTLASGASAPVLRAFLQILTLRVLPKQWQGAGWELLWAGLGCLFLLPSQWLGLSLPLSWSCAILLQISHRQSAPARGLILYLGLLPPLAFIGVAHPLVILLNLLAMPIFAGLLFPMLFATWAAPSLSALTNPIWLTINAIATTVAADLPYLKTELDIQSSVWPMAYCLLLQFGYSYHQINHSRQINKRPSSES